MHCAFCIPHFAFLLTSAMKKTAAILTAALLLPAAASVWAAKGKSSPVTQLRAKVAPAGANVPPPPVAAKHTEPAAEPAPLTDAPPLPEPHNAPSPLPAADDFPVADDPSKGWGDSLALPAIADFTPDRHFTRLSEEDFKEVAEELGVEVAAIKAVVDIEAGKAHAGFWQPGKPIINFDLSMYSRYAPRRGVSLSKARKKAPVIFARPNTRKYGSYQAAQWARLEAARDINEESALESAFWGMFQIGGFNYKLCDCDSVQQFVALMSRSERDQLKLFGRLIRNCGMLEPLQKKQWLKFALKYNGPRAKSRGYHTRMSTAYKRHKND